MKPRLVVLAVSVAVGLFGAAALGQDVGRTLSALLRDVRSADFDKSLAAVQQLGTYRQHRAQVVPPLIEAIRTGEWPRCGGDMRDAIATVLGEFAAREAVVPLLELAKSGKPIDHECVE